MAVAGMCVNDLTPFMHVGESLQLCELNLSNNVIRDISPLSGACVDTLILNKNEIEKMICLIVHESIGLIWMIIG